MYTVHTNRNPWEPTESPRWIVVRIWKQIGLVVESFITSGAADKDIVVGSDNYSTEQSLKPSSISPTRTWCCCPSSDRNGVLLKREINRIRIRAAPPREKNTEQTGETCGIEGTTNRPGRLENITTNGTMGIGVNSVGVGDHRVTTCHQSWRHRRLETERWPPLVYK